jgi:multicomponent Na+:H+ antiporter subunit G
MMLLDLLSSICLLAGAVLGIIGAIGLFRFNEFYQRVHAASLVDSFCTILILVGLALQADSWQLVGKLALIFLFLLFTTPTATHALAHSAWLHGMRPEVDDGERQS